MTNEFPLAYLITFRCYGTWVHGDKRGSMDRKHNAYGTPRLAANAYLERSDSRQSKHSPIILNAEQRKVVENAVKGVCEHRKAQATPSLTVGLLPPYVAAERGFIDEVIEPAQTRPKLIRARALLETSAIRTRRRNTGTFRCD